MKANKTFLSEDELILALKNHELIAMEALNDMYSDSLGFAISKILKDNELSKDTLQEVLFKIWNSAQSYEQNKGRLFTWMINIARHYAIDIVRSKSYKNRKKHVVINDHQVGTDRHHWVLYNPETILVRELLYHLNPKFNILLQMAYFEGYTQTEIAARLHIPLGTVKTRMRAAITALRHQIN